MKKGAELERQNTPEISVTTSFPQELINWLITASQLPGNLGLSIEFLLKNQQFSTLTLPLGKLALENDPQLSEIQTISIYNLLANTAYLQTFLTKSTKTESGGHNDFDLKNIEAALKNNPEFDENYEIEQTENNCLTFWIESKQTHERFFFRLIAIQVREKRGPVQFKYILQSVLNGYAEADTLIEQYHQFGEATKLVMNALYKARQSVNTEINFHIMPSVDIVAHLAEYSNSAIRTLQNELNSDDSEKNPGPIKSEVMPYVIPRFTLKDFIGASEETIKTSNELKDEAKNPDLYHKRGLKQPRSISIYGDAVTGKTLFAEVLAGELEANRLYYVNAKAIIEDFKGFLTTPVETALEQARENPNERIVLCIDQLDIISVSPPGSAVLSQLKEYLSNRHDWPDNIYIFTIGREINPTPVRTGRYDAFIHMELPKMKGLIQIMQTVYKEYEERAGQALFDPTINWETLASIADGFNYGAIEEVFNRALTHLTYTEKLIGPGSVSLVTQAHLHKEFKALKTTTDSHPKPIGFSYLHQINKNKKT